MTKKPLLLLVTLLFIVCFASLASAASTDANTAAADLHQLGLFQGVGTNPDGSPNFDLDRTMNRQEGVAMLVRLLGKEQAALTGTWQSPFTDVDAWAQPYVNYAYANGLTQGLSATAFGGQDTLSAAQYLTFVLRALGYNSDTDFSWNNPFALTDSLGITAGQFPSQASFLRADAAISSDKALDSKLKGSKDTLLDTLEAAGAVKDNNKPSDKDDEDDKKDKDEDDNGSFASDEVEPIEDWNSWYYQDGDNIYASSLMEFVIIKVNGKKGYYVKPGLLEELPPLALGIYGTKENRDDPFVPERLQYASKYFDREIDGDKEIYSKDGFTFIREDIYTGIGKVEEYTTLEYGGKSFRLEYYDAPSIDSVTVQNGVTIVTFSKNISGLVLPGMQYFNIEELFDYLGINKSLNFTTINDKNDCLSIN